jgi:hypothetical protein
MAKTWTTSDPRWLALNPYQRAAVMALMEANRMDPQSARNALGAMINRAAREGVDLGEHVSKPIYQPTIEPAQQARLDRILRSGEYNNLTSWAERRAKGLEPDPVQGATHFLAPEKTMLALERQNPAKYKNWGPRGANWTGYDPQTGQYRGVIMRDSSHAFLAPEGAHSVAFNGDAGGTQVAGLPGSPSGPAPSRNDQIAAPAPVSVAAAPTATTAKDTGGLLASLFGKPGGDFQSAMGSYQAPPIPTAPETPAPVDSRRPVDISQLLAILQQRQNLGTA